MELLRKFSRTLSDPKSKLFWIIVNFGRVPVLVRRRRFGALASYFIAGVTGRSVYDYYLRYLAQRSKGTLEQEIRGNTMELDLRDEGLSRDLFIYGIREERGAEVFERELEKVAGSVDDETVLDIGANIGYFALIELGALTDTASLIAFEPDERNTKLLERNLELNGYRDRTTIERAAVGPERGVVDFELAEHRNLNKVRAASTADPTYETGRTITVDEWSIDEYLQAHEIDPESVVAARMDVEGYEVEVVRGMKKLLESDGPLVLSLEIHPGRLDSSEIRDLGSVLEECGFDVVEALVESISAYPFVKTCTKAVQSTGSLPTDGPAYNVVLVKTPAGGSSKTNRDEESSTDRETRVKQLSD